MDKLHDWSIRHHVSVQALRELRHLLINQCSVVAHIEGGGEAEVQARVRLEASQCGARLWRNNVGAGMLENGSYLRWGLCNDSAALNKEIKSADLIGIKPVLITQEHVGKIIGQFLSREIKASDWKFKKTDREVAQLRWAELITGLGGDAAIVTGTGSIK